MKRKASGSHCRFKVAAAIIGKNNKIIRISCNSPRLDKIGGGTHAEMDALRRVNPNGVHAIVICRVGLSGNLLPIKCCSACTKVLSKFGIKIITI